MNLVHVEVGKNTKIAVEEISNSNGYIELKNIINMIKNSNLTAVDKKTNVKLTKVLIMLHYKLDVNIDNNKKS